MTDSEKKFKEWNRKASQNAIELIRAKRIGKPEEEINELIRQESEHNVELIKNLQENSVEVFHKVAKEGKKDLDQSKKE